MNIQLENNTGYQKALLEIQAMSVLCTQSEAKRFNLILECQETTIHLSEGHKHEKTFAFTFEKSLYTWMQKSFLQVACVSLSLYLDTSAVVLVTVST